MTFKNYLRSAQNNTDMGRTLTQLNTDRERAYKEDLRRDHLADGINAQNRAVVFTALKISGIRTVSVYFFSPAERCEIERIDAYTGVEAQEQTELPATPLTVSVIDRRRDEAEVIDLTEILKHAISTLCLEYLEQTVEDWEINYSPCGTFTFDVDQSTIVLEYSNDEDGEEVNYYYEF